MIYNRIWHENRKRTKKQKSTWNPIFSKIAHNSLNNGRRAVLIPFLDFQYFWTFWVFLLLKSFFFDTIFMKKAPSFWGAQTPFSSRNCNFLILRIFHVFGAVIIVFFWHFFGKIDKFLRGGDAFFVKKYTSCFRGGYRS